MLCVRAACPQHPGMVFCYETRHVQRVSFPLHLTANEEQDVPCSECASALVVLEVTRPSLSRLQAMYHIEALIEHKEHYLAQNKDLRQVRVAMAAEANRVF